MQFDVLLTHSSRPVDLNQCSFEALSRRYADPHRLEKTPPFESLASTSEARAYSGGVTLLRLTCDADRFRVEDLGYRDPGQKVQHASFTDEGILLCMEDSLLLVSSFEDIPESYPGEGDPRRIDDPWFAGLHTCFPIKGSLCLTNASGPDALMWVDLSERRVVKRVRLPEFLYGTNYRLDENRSVREHYISNDYQIAHINCAYPAPDGSIVYSTLIQGDVGRLDRQGAWTLYRRGNIGCHGARVTDDGSTLYFADSVRGDLVIIPFGGVERRIHRPSRWLHDVQQLPNSAYFLLSESDWNALTIVDGRNGQVVFERQWDDRSASTQFLHVRGAAAA